ncbi:MAG: AtzH-like domain-containing protein [Sneathiella sp.]|uniref:AtzH-like domain-containing protein n=1 Tax=Sneathiella sp. TaxID=1964365 RepID=UPI00300257E2
MSEFEPNIPEVIAEVREKFEAYETALAEKDVDVLDNTFWNSPFTVRLAMSEHGYGFDAIHDHRVARPPGPSIKEKRIRLEILTIGHTVATVNLEFKVLGQDLIGRQSQSWVKFPELGWKVISAHVSTTDGTKLW